MQISKKSEARRASADRTGYLLEIFCVSAAVLLLEISFTRIISYKLFYYFTYLVIGLALCGLGCGGVLVAISARLRRAATETVVLWSAVVGALAVGVGYLIVALLPTNTITIWEYTRTGLANVVLLFLLCLALFASFLPAGIILSTLFGRRPERIGRMDLADLVGAGIACLIVVPLIAAKGVPTAVACAGLLFALAASSAAVKRRSGMVVGTAALACLALVCAIFPSLVPDVRLDTGKKSGDLSSAPLIYSSWSPNFRIDLREGQGGRLLFHDGLVGSGMLQWDGKRSSLSSKGFDDSYLALPFAVAGDAPAKEAVIGAAAGHEVLASLYFNAKHIDAVELNPVTVDLVKHKMADYDGHLAQQPGVNYMNGDGRSFLARTKGNFNVIWFPAPDSYSATNAATSSALVLSESYLYTTGALHDSLDRLAPGGIIAAQFGEIDASRPNRTLRYVTTVRAALAKAGISDASDHLLVGTVANSLLGSKGERFAGVFTNILVKKQPFTPAEVSRFTKKLDSLPGAQVRYVPGGASNDPLFAAAVHNQTLRLPDGKKYPYAVGPVTDNKPFFWHFTPFNSVIRTITHREGSINLEIFIGERVLLLLLFVALLLALVFLLLPFLAIRRTWAELPRKPSSGLFFGAVGLGFMAYEIALIQKLVLFLGYPTYSLTVTLSSLLISVGIGAYASPRWLAHRRAVPLLGGLIAALTVYYLFGLQPTTDALQHLPLGARVLVSFLVVAPLGVCLGTFLPLGLSAVARLSPSYEREYVAWGWAVNGFASVVASVLATIIAMTYGFRVVFALALICYLVALTMVRNLRPGQSPTATEPPPLSPAASVPDSLAPVTE
jgi:hypothetical protein